MKKSSVYFENEHENCLGSSGLASNKIVDLIKTLWWKGHKMSKSTHILTKWSSSCKPTRNETSYVHKVHFAWDDATDEVYLKTVQKQCKQSVFTTAWCVAPMIHSKLLITLWRLDNSHSDIILQPPELTMKFNASEMQQILGIWYATPVSFLLERRAIT